METFLLVLVLVLIAVLLFMVVQGKTTDGGGRVIRYQVKFIF